MLNLIRKQVQKRFSEIKHGSLVLKDPYGTDSFGNLENSPDLQADLTVKNVEFYRLSAIRGSIGMAEAYMQNMWETNDLTKLVRLFARNRNVLDKMEKGSAWFKNKFIMLRHFLNKNTFSGSRKNIAAHYDLSNEFFQLFLDKRMMYSSAVFTKDADTLESASELKLKTICEKLQLSRDDNVIEIGTGWGGFAVYAASNYGCKVTTTTISQKQADYARRKVKECGLENKINIVQKDYRSLDGIYDKLVSIEMIEAVGHHFLPVYIEKCSSLLKEDGLALIQAITLEDYRYKQALGSVDFIQRYIFPGSCIPCLSAILEQTAKVSDFRLINLEDIGTSYAKTLNSWCRRFMKNVDKVKKQGFNEAFIKMWEFYLCYCEGGFLEKSISDVQLLFAKPGNRKKEQLAFQS